MLDECVIGTVNRGRNRCRVFRCNGMAASICRDSFDFDDRDTPGCGITFGWIAIGIRAAKYERLGHLAGRHHVLRMIPGIFHNYCARMRRTRCLGSRWKWFGHRVSSQDVRRTTARYQCGHQCRSQQVASIWRFCRNIHSGQGSVFFLPVHMACLCSTNTCSPIRRNPRLHCCRHRQKALDRPS